MKIRVIVAAMVAVMLVPVLSIAGDVLIIGNPSVTASFLSEKELSKIYLGKKTAWGDGTKIVFVIQKNSDTHKAFLKEYVHKSPSQFDRHWKKLVFTGKGSSPQAFDSEKALIKFVSDTKGAIGYVSTDSNLENVKTISVK